MMDNYFENIDWKKQRLGKFTASEIHKLFVSGRKKDELFGVGAATYIRTKVAEEITLEIKEDADFKQAEWGALYEPEAVKRFEAVTGLSGIHFGVANPKFFDYGDHAGGSPDWDAEVIGADIKCPYNSSEHILNLGISSVKDFLEIRWEYYCQAQMLMKIRGWQRFYFVSYDPRMPLELQLKLIVVTPDAEWLTEFELRLAAAIERKLEMINSLSSPSLIVAEFDAEVNAVIVK